MNIAIDIDETAFKGTVIPAVAMLYNEMLPYEFDLSDWCDEAQELAFKLFKNRDIMCDLIPNSDVLDYVNTMQKAGHTVYMITARPECQQEATQAMVDLYFDNVEVTACGGYDKKDVYEMYDIDIVIDDNPKHIQEAIGIGAKGVLYSNEGTPWNHEFRDSNPEIMSVQTLREMAGDIMSQMEYWNGQIEEILCLSGKTTQQQCD